MAIIMLFHLIVIQEIRDPCVTVPNWYILVDIGYHDNLRVVFVLRVFCVSIFVRIYSRSEI